MKYISSYKHYYISVQLHITLKIKLKSLPLLINPYLIWLPCISLSSHTFHSLPTPISPASGPLHLLYSLPGKLRYLFSLPGWLPLSSPSFRFQLKCHSLKEDFPDHYLQHLPPFLPPLQLLFVFPSQH